MNVLFLCTSNRLRSPTAEAVFSGRPGLQVASAGLHPDCVRPVTAALLDWADMVFVMEHHHRKTLKQRFRDQLGTKSVVVLGIPDEYERMQPELVEILERKVPPFLERE
jgi:predicted protein tyrosine phosphatase